ncbi:G-protein coupled receptor 4-like [Symphorus nematophorus]
MADFYINITSWNNSYNYTNTISNNSNINSSYFNSIIPSYSHHNSYIIFDFLDHSSISFNDEYKGKVKFIIAVLTWIIIGISLPLTLMAICSLHSLVQNDQVAPIYVINLLIADLIQLCCMIVRVATTEGQKIFVFFHYIYLSALLASVVFMVCIALERYLVVAWPLWYRFRRTIKSSVVVCVLVWVLDSVIVLILYFWVHSMVRYTVFGLFFLLPFPLFIFFLGGTLKALSATISVPSDEKRRIVGVLVLVLLIYTLLFLPRIISNLADGVRSNSTLDTLSFIFLELSPLADLTLYIFMRKGTIDKLLSSACCCRMDSDDTNSPSE